MRPAGHSLLFAESRSPCSVAEPDIGGIFDLLVHYGYWIVAIAALVEAMPLLGWLVPGQAIIIVAGAVAAAGHLNVVTLILVAIPAGIIGDAAGFYIGRRYGREFLEKYGPRLRIGPQHLARSDALFAKYGPFALVVARFSFLTRAVGPIFAGMARMRPALFWPVNVIGAVAWSVAYSLLGFFLGVSFLALQAQVGRILAFTVVGVVGLYLFYRVLRKYAAQFTRDDLYIVLVGAAAGALFGVIADHVQDTGAANVINAQAGAIHALFSPLAPMLVWLDAAMTLVVLGALSLGAVAYFFFKRRWWDATLIALGVGGIIVLVASLRPIFRNLLPADVGESWPSMSPAVLVVLLGVVTYLVAWRTRRRRTAYLTASVGAVLATSALWASLATGKGSPSAVVAGHLLGIVWLCVTVLVVEFRLKTSGDVGEPAQPRG